MSALITWSGPTTGTRAKGRAPPSHPSPPPPSQGFHPGIPFPLAPACACVCVHACVRVEGVLVSLLKCQPALLCLMREHPLHPLTPTPAPAPPSTSLPYSKAVCVSFIPLSYTCVLSTYRSPVRDRDGGGPCPHEAYRLEQEQ